MRFNIDRHLALQENALLLRSRRASILASNLANVDTPNYKARDIPFTAALKNAEKSQIATNHKKHIPVSATVSTSALAYRIPHQPSYDGNSVEADIEQSHFAENAVRYRATMKMLNSRITGLIRVLRGE